MVIKTQTQNAGYVTGEGSFSSVHFDSSLSQDTCGVPNNTALSFNPASLATERGLCY